MKGEIFRAHSAAPGTEHIYFRFREPQIDLFDFELNSQDFKEVGSNHVAEIQDEDKDNRDEPKNVQGKVVASCKRCGNISIDIGRCTECNKILPEGMLIHLHFVLFVYYLSDPVC